MAKPITKYAVHVTEPYQACFEFEKAWHIANSGRRGAVLFDIPMNIQRTEIDTKQIKHYIPKQKEIKVKNAKELFEQALNNSERPVFLIGNGVSESYKNKLINFAEKYNIPIVTSLLQRTLLPVSHPLNFGYIGGGYGMRAANLIAAAKADLLICIGISLCAKQTGTKINDFAERASIFRIDNDKNALQRKIKENEISLCMDSGDFIDIMIDAIPNTNYENWFKTAEKCRQYCDEFDKNIPERYPNRIISSISEMIPKGTPIACDVGQHMMWTAQSFVTKSGQKLLFSGGHGAMGYALPAAIGAYYSTNTQTICICGDGAFQMNIQELQWIARENIPITIFIMNNNSLGLITQLQDAYFDGKHFGADTDGGFTVPNFTDIAKAYGIESYRIQSVDEIEKISEKIGKRKPLLIEIMLPSNTKAYPKTRLGQAIYNQEPLMPEELISKMLAL